MATSHHQDASATVAHDLEGRYQQLQRRYHNLREGKAVWRQYHRQTHQFETYAEALGEIEAQLTHMRQMLETAPGPLLLQMELNEPSEPGTEGLKSSPQR